MGKMTDSFVIYEIWDVMAKIGGPDATEYYNTYLFNVTGDEFLNKTGKIIRNCNETVPDCLHAIMIRMKYGEDKFVKELNSTVFFDGKYYVDRFKEDAYFWSYCLLGVGGLFLVCGYVMVTCLSTAANNQTQRIRIIFFKAVLRQDISWFDTNTSGDFASKVTGLVLLFS